MKLINEFKTFAMRGNVLDMAVGVIIGGAFGKIISSLVADVLMPPIGMLIGGINFTEWKIILHEAVLTAGEVTKPAVTLNIGNFIQTVIDFTIIAFSIFLMIKAINTLFRKKDDDPAPTKQEELLTEIRDLLKK
ncbi:MAG: large-conductance mechanosensitive channel protein MscL [Tannerella sp.]|jgi:large conductance mechanosensitive channel|nr:large-conductance mechanosensitive channel protein MscL [Tannerella sp.]